MNFIDTLMHYYWCLTKTKALHLLVTKRHIEMLNSDPSNLLLLDKHRIKICDNAKMIFAKGPGKSQYTLYAYFLGIYRKIPRNYYF